MLRQMKSSTKNCCLSNQCCCSCQKYPNKGQHSNHTTKYAENYVNEEDEYSRNRSSKQNLSNGYNFEANDDSQWIDEQTLLSLSTLREKACRFIKSESEKTSDSESSDRACMCQGDNFNGEKNKLRRAQEMIDYVPESVFLKKMKEQCQYSENNKERPNFLSGFDGGSNLIPYVCEKCIGHSKPILKLGEQLNNGKIKSATDDSRMCCKCCKCKNDLLSNTSGINFLESTFRSGGNEPTSSLTNDKLFKNELLLCSCAQMKENENSDQSKKKVQHVSRSKKPSKCRRRRKRKSHGVEKSLSQDHFEPTLKKPHPNSCERCWRYASPSRSPVNKPDQRHNPNFRRGHSYTNFVAGEEFGKGDNSFEVTGKHISGLKSSQPNTPNRVKELSFPQNESQRPDQTCNCTKMKELMFHYAQTPEKNHQVVSPVDGNRKAVTPEYQNRNFMNSDRVMKPRRKCRTPDVASKAAENSSNIIENSNVTEYGEIAVKSKLQGVDVESGSKSIKNTRNTDLSSPGDNSCERSILKKHSSTKKDVGTKKNFEKLNLSFKQLRNKNLKSRLITQSELMSKSSSSDKKTNQYVKVDQNNNKSKARSPKCKRKLDFDISSGTQTSGQTPPTKPPSSSEFQERCVQFYEQGRVVSLDRSKPSLSSVDQNNEISGCAKITDQWLEPPHVFRDCTCYCESPQTRKTEYSRINDKEKSLFCCHCQGEGNVKYRNNEPNCRNWSAPGASRQNRELTETPFPQSSSDLNERPRSSNVNYNNRDPGHVFPNKKEYVEKNFMQDFQGKIVPCPYRQHVYDNVDESYPPGSRKQSQNIQTVSSMYTPKKYCIFYMTKSKDNKGNDVEVLVEELTQRSSHDKDSKMDALRNKMKRMSGCQSDSMALRFQKGVSELCKTQPNCRVLYF